MSEATIGQLQNELEEIINWFSSEDVSIDEAEDKYSRALEIARQIKQKIELTENRIVKIRKTFEEAI